ncbi:MAG TPA: hypothetical protein PKA95_18650 [Thermomicrobiales bacterium]|nr:hypothetical protein [Thermomicrobiales bacterium]
MQRLTTSDPSNGIRREEILAAAAETLGLFLIFVVAISTRDLTGDAAKAILIALTWVVGVLGAGYGAIVFWRGATQPAGRVARLALGAAMAFMGVYSIVHVMS